MASITVNHCPRPRYIQQGDKAPIHEVIINPAELAALIGSGPGGATAWGVITGTLSNQTDLNSALSGKAPSIHSHAPGDITGTAIVNADSRLSDARTPLAHNQVISTITGLQTALDGKEPANSNIQTHVTSAHAPSNAQKNSDITKAEIEAKLTGELTSHSHAAEANDPTVDQKAALAGSSGAPSVSNKYVTDADTRNTNARAPIAHSHAPSDITGTAVITTDGRLSDARTPTAHNQDASTINAGTLDGDRLPTLSTGKRGGVPATGTPSGKYLKDDGSWSMPSGGGGSTPDVSYFRKVGVTNFEAWYTSPHTGTALTATAVTAGRLYAIPFLCPKAITLDRIAFNVTTLLAGKAHAGIYNDNGSMYPGSLLLDGGELDTGTTGVKSTTINQALSASSLYWLAFLANVAITIRGFAIASMLPILGISNALGTAPNLGLYVTQTYGALPGTFPGTPTMIIAAPIPAIFVRLSA